MYTLEQLAIKEGGSFSRNKPFDSYAVSTGQPFDAQWLLTKATEYCADNKDEWDRQNYIHYPALTPPKKKGADDKTDSESGSKNGKGKRKQQTEEPPHETARNVEMAALKESKRLEEEKRLK